MKLPDHLSLTISHNEHKVYYEPLDDYLRDRGLKPCAAWRARMLAMDEVWECTWYPDTPVGHCILVAPTLGELLSLLGDV